MNAKVYEIVNNKIKERLENALKTGEKFYWVKPWAGEINHAENYTSRKAYRGCNALILDAGEYITYNQYCELLKVNPSLKIVKGCKQSPVFYFNFTEKESENGEIETIPYFRYYRVFNIKDIEGLETHYPVERYKHNTTAAMEEADNVIKEYLERETITLNIQDGSSRAFYRLMDHSITLPDKTQFKSQYEYYSTVFHECVHSTGKTLNRDLKNCFGDDNYSFEELVAEIGAQMLCAALGIEDDNAFNNSLAYIQSWSKKLDESNVSFIVKASNQAQKAVDLILNELFEVETTA